MNESTAAAEIFMRMVAQNHQVYVMAVPAVRIPGDGEEEELIVTPEIPAHYRDRNDAELEALMVYARRAARRVALLPFPIPPRAPEPIQPLRVAVLSAARSVIDRLLRNRGVSIEQ